MSEYDWDKLLYWLFSIASSIIFVTFLVSVGFAGLIAFVIFAILSLF